MIDELDGFAWDEHNVGHISRHEVTPMEVEEAARRPALIVPAQPRGGEQRWKLLGKTTAGRYLVVVFTVRQNKFRAVTAHTMNASERRLYGPQIDQA